MIIYLHRITRHVTLSYPTNRWCNSIPCSLLTKTFFQFFLKMDTLYWATFEGFRWHNSKDRCLGGPATLTLILPPCFQQVLLKLFFLSVICKSVEWGIMTETGQNKTSRWGEIFCVCFPEWSGSRTPRGGARVGGGCNPLPQLGHCSTSASWDEIASDLDELQGRRINPYDPGAGSQTVPWVHTHWRMSNAQTSEGAWGRRGLERRNEHHFCSSLVWPGWGSESTTSQFQGGESESESFFFSKS